MVALNGRISGFFSIIHGHVAMNWIVVFTVSTEGKEEREKKEKERIPFSLKEQEKIWKAYDAGDLRACAPLLMIYTGMMPGEAMKLRVEHIDIENRVILNAGMKTKVRKATPIVIADCLLPVMDDLVKHAMPSGYIWRQNEKIWYDAYYALLSDLGCRRLTPYSCRHTTATALSVTENIAPQTIKRIMRWSTVRMLDHYSHPDTSDALQGVNTLKKNNVHESTTSITETHSDITHSDISVSDSPHTPQSSPLTPQNSPPTPRKEKTR